jgi:hypothetical protein
VAVWVYRDALNADPRSFAAHFAMGEALARLRRWGAASKAFRAAAALQPADVESQGNVVLALYRSGRLREAAVAMRRLIDLRPGEPELHLALGVIQGRMGRPAEAIRTFRWAARLTSPSTTHRFFLGEALFGDRYWAEVLGHLDSGRNMVAPPAPLRPRRQARARAFSRLKAAAAVLDARLQLPAVAAAALCRLLARGEILVARGFARSSPHLAIRLLRAAQRRCATT